MKRGTVILLVVVGVVLLLVAGIASTYNGMIGVDENVKKAWGQVEVQYQRRVDLIPNLVETVKAVAEKEKGTFTEIAALRSGVAQAQKVLSDPNSTEDQKIQAYGQMDQAKNFIMKINVEAYPNLKFPENFSKLQDELAGTENRVAVARTDYNTAVQEYNTRIRTFPRSLFAAMLGFKVKEPFRAAAGAENVPKVEF